LKEKARKRKREIRELKLLQNPRDICIKGGIRDLNNIYIYIYI